MRRFIPIFLSLLLLIGCDTGGQASTSDPKPESSPSSVSEPAPAPDPAPNPLPVLLPGRILSFEEAQQRGFPVQDVKGTQAELDRWKKAVWDPAIVRLDYNNMSQESMVLPVEQEMEILTAMRDAEVRLYEGNPNPSTGGGCSVTAYDGEEKVLFHISYLGDFFTVYFPGEEVCYYFDGEGTTLDDLGRSDYGVSGTSAAPQQAPDTEPEPQPTPGTERILAMGDPLLNFGGEMKVGTQYELDLWETYINEPVLTRIDFSNRHDTGRELSTQEEKKILAALWNAELRLYDALPNPSTGSACHVIAYDGRDNIMFHAVFMGDWFCVKFADEDVQYVFDGEGTTLNDLFGIS